MEFNPTDIFLHVLINVPISPKQAAPGSLEHYRAVPDEWTVP